MMGVIKICDPICLYVLFLKTIYFGSFPWYFFGGGWMKSLFMSFSALTKMPYAWVKQIINQIKDEIENRNNWLMLNADCSNIILDI